MQEAPAEAPLSLRGGLSSPVVGTFVYDNDPGEAPRRSGWTILAVLAVTEAVSSGVLYYAFAVFLPAVHRSRSAGRLGLAHRPALSARVALSVLIEARAGTLCRMAVARLLRSGEHGPSTE
jgi:hypothetical protein